MKITDAGVRTFRISSDIRNSVISFGEMTVSVVALVTDQVRHGKPLIGFGFNSNGRYGQEGLLTERALPRLLRAKPEALTTEDGRNFDPGSVLRVVRANEKPGGHGERSVAIGIIDMAVWDIVAKLEDAPLADVVARRVGRPEALTKVPVYAAGGYYNNRDSLEVLCDEMKRYLERGYQSLKMKIGGTSLADDLKRVEAVLTLVPPERLAVDANGRLNSDEALAYVRALCRYGLRWFEEPGDPLDYSLYALLAEEYPRPIATGENLFSVQDVMNLMRYGGLRPDQDILQMDPVLSYGVGEYQAMIASSVVHGWTSSRLWPHGGHLLNLCLAAGLGLGGIETYPEHFRPFSCVSRTTRITDGCIAPTDSPGLGIEAFPDLWRLVSAVIPVAV